MNSFRKNTWYNIEIQQVARKLSSGESGLLAAAAQKRLAEFGGNEIFDLQKKSRFAIFLDQFKGTMIIILLVAAVISGVLGDITDAVVIISIVLINALIGYFQESRAANAMQALKSIAIPDSKVYRDNKIVVLSSVFLVPGDVVFLEVGNIVPADMRLIESVNLFLDESTLTGESVPVQKDISTLYSENLPLGDLLNMAFKGTIVARGHGKGMVTATGMDTELGRIARLLQEGEVLTPLQLRMKFFAKKLSVIVLLLCLLFFLSGLLRGEKFNNLLLTSISLAVAAIPEALTAVITISLALAAKRMAALKCLIRKLAAIETLGTVTYICTDKTGTLTKNKMEVERIFFEGNAFEKNQFEMVKNTENGNLLLQSFVSNCDLKHTDGNNLIGDGTEIALFEVAGRVFPEIESLPRKAEIDFDRNRKLMTTFHPFHRQIIGFTKGAPDVLLHRCINVDVNGLLQRVDAMAGQGLRVIGFAYRLWDTLPNLPTSANQETGLHFLGLAGILDPPREEVIDAIASCRNAGITPVMITGDHQLTAKAIATRIGIINREDDLIINGQQLDELNEAALLASVEKISVYARVSPAQKFRIVKALQDRGHCVAMTGDGVNDAPALKRANIGIAMGITGSDVSREAAHIILLDDNFSTIVRSIREGRRVYDNILKFVKYLMTTNSGELLTLLIGPFIGLPLALLPVHILWINLISDGFPAIALSFEKGEKNIMNRPPRPASEGIFGKKRGFHMLWVGLLMASITLALQSWAIKNELHWQTIVFNVLCLSQMGHVLAIRSERQSLFSLGLSSNKTLTIAVLMAVFLQFLVSSVPFLQSIFRTQSLTCQEFFIIVIASSFVFFAVEIEKLISNRDKQMKE